MGTPCPGPRAGSSAYCYTASRDFEDIDPVSTSGLHAALAAGGFTPADMTVSWVLQDLGSDVDGVDWMLNGSVETRYYTGGTFEIKLNGEALVGGPMPRSTPTIDYADVNNCFDDAISSVTDTAVSVDQSEGSSASVQVAAAAFLADLGPGEIFFEFTSFQPAIQVEFSGGGRSGAFFVLPNSSINVVDPGPPPGSDDCSCIIGVFEADNTHDWSLVCTDVSGPASGEAVLKVAASSVNGSETGSIVVNIVDNVGLKSTTVVHPATGDTVDFLPLDLTAGVTYPFTVMTTGDAHHYKLGSENPELAVGQMEVSYLEGLVQDWGARAGAGETVQLEIMAYTANMGGNQATQVQVTVYDELTTALVYGPGLRTLSLDTPEVFTFSNWPTARSLGVRIDPGQGHFRMRKVGGDEYFYALPCPEQGGPVVPVPGLSRWGLIAMAAMMAGAVLYALTRARRAPQLQV